MQMFITKQDIPLIMRVMLEGIFRGNTEPLQASAQYFPNSYVKGDKLYVVNTDNQHVATISVKVARCRHMKL